MEKSFQKRLRVTMKTLQKIKNNLKYFDRYFSAKTSFSEKTNSRLEFLRRNGYLILNDFIPKQELEKMQSKYKQTLEKDLRFETPCLGQTLIDEVKHKEKIENYLLHAPSDLLKDGLGFTNADFLDYNDLLSKYNPSTLKTYLSDIEDFFSIWLNEELLDIIEAYLGLRPHLIEAYLRRNFPAKYKVMNHFWHRDSNHPDFLVKAFFFLSDCSIENGPHEYISGSIQDRRLDGKPYYTEEEINRIYPEGSSRIVRSIVKAGTVILEDTRGLHRAVIPRKGFRDLGYAVFTPLSKFSRSFKSFYTIGRSQYETLNQRQQSYIPAKNLRD